VFILNVLLLSGLATENGHVVHTLVRNTSLFFYPIWLSAHISLLELVSFWWVSCICVFCWGVHSNVNGNFLLFCSS